MPRAAKTNRLAAQLPLRKSAMSASAASRRSFPAWIDANERVATFAAGAQPRVRDGLVLRKVGRKKPAGAETSARAKEPRHGHHAR